MMHLIFRLGRTIRCGLAALALLSAAAGGAARAQVISHEAPPVTLERLHRAQLMLGLPTAPTDLAGAAVYVQNGRAIPVWLVRAPVGDWREAKELAVTYAPGVEPAFVALDRVVFSLADGGAREDATALVRAIDSSLGEAMTRPGRAVFIVETGSALRAFELAEKLAALPGVRFAHPDGYGAKALDGVVPTGMGGEVRVSLGGVDQNDGALVDFGTVLQNTTVDHTFTVHNDGGNTLIIDTVMTTGGYQVTQQPAGMSILPGDTDTFTIRVPTGTPGVVNGSLSFLNNDADENPFNLNLTATVDAGVGPAEIAVSVDGNDIPLGGTFAFGTTPLGVPVQRVFRISNLGGTTLSVGTVTVPSGFLVLTQPTTVVPANSFTEFTVRMLATTAGDPSGTVSFLNSDADENPFQFTIDGTVSESGPGPQVAVLIDGVAQANGAVVDFGTTPMGTYVMREIELRNTGVGELRLLYLRLPPGFSIRNVPQTVIPANTSTTLEITLDAECDGTMVGDLFIQTNVQDAEEFTLVLAGVVDPRPPSGGIEDFYFSRQWHHVNTGQLGGQSGFDVRSVEAWEDTMGDGAIVAILDSGVQLDHPEYAARLVGHSLNDFDYEQSFFGGGGSHGTCVAGLVAAEVNFCGGRGVAPEAGIFSSSIYNSDADMAMTMYDADAAGASLHTNSWSYTNPTYLPDVMRDAIEDLSVNGAGGRGMLFLWSSGNDDRPAVWRSALTAMPETMLVGAMTNVGRRSVYSNIGPWMDVTGPSNGGPAALFTTDVTGASGYNSAQSFQDGDFMFSFGGTSGSTPIVAGVAALVRAAAPDLHAQQVRRILRHTADQALVAGDDDTFDAITKFSDAFGYGLADARAAVDAALESATNGGWTWPAAATNLRYQRTSGGNSITWDIPDAEDVRAEYVGSLLVSYAGAVTWRPTDGFSYDELVGTSPSDGVRILASGPERTFAHDGVTPLQKFTYLVFTFNGVRRYSFAEKVVAFPVEPQTIFFDSMEGADPGWSYEAPEVGPRGIIGDPTGISEWERGEPNTTSIELDGFMSCNGAPCNPAIFWGNPIPMPPSLVGFTAPFSGQKVMGTDLDGFYSAETTHYLVSPVIDLTNPNFGSYSLSFRELLDIEGGGADTARLRVLDADTGSVIRTLLIGHQKLTYEWREQWFDLRNQRGRRIQLLFALEADQIGQFAGWYLDDVRVGASVGSSGPPGGNRPRRIFLPGFEIPPAEEAGAGGDVNYDDIIDFDDLAVLMDRWGETRELSWFSFDADLDGDGRIGVGDVLVMLSLLQSEVLRDREEAGSRMK